MYGAKPSQALKDKIMQLIPDDHHELDMVLELSPTVLPNLDSNTFKSIFKALLYQMPYTGVSIEDYELGDMPLSVCLQTLGNHWQLRSIKLRNLGATSVSAASIGKIVSNKAPSLRVSAINVFEQSTQRHDCRHDNVLSVC